MNTQSELALLHNDMHVLENHHCSVGFKLMKETALLQGMAPADMRVLRKLVVDAILNTDMAEHKNLLARVERRLPGSDGPPLSPDTLEDRQLLVSFLLHVADICTPTLPIAVSKRVADRLGEEFEAQARLEKAHGLDVSVMLAAKAVQKAAMESSFITYVVRPLYVVLVRLAPDLDVFLARVDLNFAMWAAIAKDGSGRSSRENSRRLLTVKVDPNSSSEGGTPPGVARRSQTDTKPLAVPNRVPE